MPQTLDMWVSQWESLPARFGKHFKIASGALLPPLTTK